jgi:hypothetical protein
VGLLSSTTIKTATPTPLTEDQKVLRLLRARMTPPKPSKALAKRPTVTPSTPAGTVRPGSAGPVRAPEPWTPERLYGPAILAEIQASAARSASAAAKPVRRLKPEPPPEPEPLGPRLLLGR